MSKVETFYSVPNPVNTAKTASFFTLSLVEVFALQRELLVVEFEAINS